MAVYPQEQMDRLVEYNSGFYDPNTNPFGMANGGHIPNFPLSLSDTVMVVQYVAQLATELTTFVNSKTTEINTSIEDANGDFAALKVQIEMDLQDAEDARDLAQDWATKGEDLPVAAGLFSAFHWARKAAASAAAAAGFDPALFARLIGATFTGPVVTAPPSADRAGFRLGTGGAKPTNPVAGDMYLDPDNNSNLRIMRAGTDRLIWDSGSLANISQAEAEAGTATASRAYTAQRVTQQILSIIPSITQAQAEAGSDAIDRRWSALRVFQAIFAAIPAGTQALAEALTDGTLRRWSAQQLAQAVRAVLRIDGWYLHQRIALGGTSLGYVTELPSAAKEYRITLRGVLPNTTAATSVIVRCGVAGGNADIGASDYYVLRMSNADGTFTSSAVSTNAVPLPDTQLSGGPKRHVIEGNLGDENIAWSSQVISHDSGGGTNELGLRFAHRSAKGRRPRIFIIFNNQISAGDLIVEARN